MTTVDPEAAALELLRFTLAVQSNDVPRCEVVRRCGNPDCPDCGQPQPCPRTAALRLSCKCGDGCGATVVMVLCEPCADELEPGLTPPITRRPL